MSNSHKKIKLKNKLISPILKWAGGKRQLLSEIDLLMPEKKNKYYYEPFLGGGSVLFHLQPKNAVVNDVNQELINVYNIVKNKLTELIEDLKIHQNNAEYFYKIRALDRQSETYSTLSDIQKASRIIFLNKTCFNGLFRVNSIGEFNSPFGSYKNPNIVNEITLNAVSKFFNDNNIIFKCGDFQDSLIDIKKDSFVYLDPPYDPISLSSNFTGYTKTGFGEFEQKRLKDLCDELDSKGIKFLLSNSCTDFIKDLYKNYNIKIIQAKRSINSNSEARGLVDEVLIRNYEQ